MRVVIVGAGMVGTILARHLIDEKHEVSLVEQDESRARHASNRLDCLVVHGSGNNIRTLEDAGIGRADALVAVTQSDELNLIICGLVEARYPQVKKIARVRNEEYDELTRGNNRALGIDHFVDPDIEAAQSVVSALAHGALGDVLSFGDSPFELGTIPIHAQSPFCGIPVKQFRSLAKAEVLLTMVHRAEETLIPSGTTTLLEGDRVYVLGTQDQIKKVYELNGQKYRSLKKIAIIGGSRVGILTIRSLLEKSATPRRGTFFSWFFRSFSQKNLLLIDKDYEVCKRVAAQFPQILVLNEDISDETFVSEEGLHDLDAVVTTTENQELNIITALYLKNRGVDRAIALVGSPGYAAIARHLGIDVIVPMKSVVVDSILTFLLGEGINRFHSLGDGSVEVMELHLGDHSELIGTRLDVFGLVSGALILYVQRGKETFIPQGNYEFKAQDRIVVLAKKGFEQDLKRLFGHRS
ncbi:MAG: Trk system potassium transporter TrkA [Breznakiellaceae bacterium]